MYSELKEKPYEGSSSDDHVALTGVVIKDFPFLKDWILRMVKKNEVLNWLCSIVEPVVGLYPCSSCTQICCCNRNSNVMCRTFPAMRYWLRSLTCSVIWSTMATMMTQRTFKRSSLLSLNCWMVRLTSLEIMVRSLLNPLRHLYTQDSQWWPILLEEEQEEFIKQGRMKNTPANRAVFAVKMKYIHSHVCDGISIAFPFLPHPGHWL